MLSRTADHLYWMSRYMERAENIARFLDVASRFSLSGADKLAVWQPVLTIAGDPKDFADFYGEVSAGTVIDWSVINLNNPSSIHACLRAARENAHAVRSVLPNELWEAINSTWLGVKGVDGHRLRDEGLTGFCDWVKERSHLSRGVTYGTMLRDEPYQFLRLGTFLERADNTARLLGVRAAGFSLEGEVDPSDTMHWAAVLRSVSAFKAYRTLFKDDVDPAAAVRMLMLMDEVPRSLHFCMDQVSEILDQLCGSFECARLAGAAHAALHWGRLDQLLTEGLDIFIARFIEDNEALGTQIHADFMMSA